MSQSNDQRKLARITAKNQETSFTAFGQERYLATVAQTQLHWICYFELYCNLEIIFPSPIDYWIHFESF